MNQIGILSECLFALVGCIEGFENCRPILYLDGTHLKSRFKGCLLSATGKDANDGIVSYLCLLFYVVFSLLAMKLTCLSL